MISRELVYDDILLITLAGTENGNRLSAPGLAHLLRILDSVGVDASLQGAIITNTGEYFCSGGPWRPDGPTERLPRPLLPMKPTVAAVRGHAYGGGLALILACNAVVSLPDATFGPSFVPGIAADNELGLAQTLVQDLGHTRAAEIIYTGRALGAKEAMRLGLIDRISNHSDIVLSAVELLRRCSRG